MNHIGLCKAVIFDIIKKLILNIVKDLNKFIIATDCLNAEIIQAEYNKVFDKL